MRYLIIIIFAFLAFSSCINKKHKNDVEAAKFLDTSIKMKFEHIIIDTLREKNDDYDNYDQDVYILVKVENRTEKNILLFERRPMYTFGNDSIGRVYLVLEESTRNKFKKRVRAWPKTDEKIECYSVNKKSEGYFLMIINYQDIYSLQKSVNSNSKNNGFVEKTKGSEIALNTLTFLRNASFFYSADTAKSVNLAYCTENLYLPPKAVLIKVALDSVILYNRKLDVNIKEKSPFFILNKLDSMHKGFVM